MGDGSTDCCRILSNTAKPFAKRPFASTPEMHELYIDMNLCITTVLVSFMLPLNRRTVFKHKRIQDSFSSLDARYWIIYGLTEFIISLRYTGMKI